RALEIGGNFDRKQHGSGGQQTIELGLAVDNVGDVEICGVLNGLENRTADIALFLQQHRGRQVPGIGVDGVPEQQKLNERDHDDHGEGNTVALELDELLDQHRPSPAPEATVGACAGSARLDQRAHWKSSLARPMRSMKTSSSEGSDRVQTRSGRARWGATAASSAASSRPHTCRLVPNGATMSMPGRRLSCSASSFSPSPLRVVTV